MHYPLGRYRRRQLRQPGLLHSLLSLPDAR
jgi:hypothetical protein